MLKMRGSAHDKRIREFTIDSNGMQILGSFQGVGGILAGRAAPFAPAESDDESVEETTTAG